jgi:hypothetical protein
VTARQIASAVAAMALLSSPVAGFAERQGSRTPKFADYPAPVFRGRKPSLRMDRREREFRTRFRALHGAPANFAGHYSVGEVGCGMGCTFLLAVDLKTGKPADFGIPSGEELEHCPEEYHDAKGDPVFHEFHFRPDSRLMVVTGKMPDNPCGARYFEERNGNMTLLRDVRLPVPQ